MSFTDVLHRAQALFWFNHDAYGNSVHQWLVAAIIFLGVAVVARSCKAFVTWRAEGLAQRTSKRWCEAVAASFKSTKTWFLLLIALYLASLVLVFPAKTRSIIDSLMVVGLLLQAAIWGNVLLSFAINGYIASRPASDTELVTAVSSMSFFAKALLWSLVALLALQNVGIDVTALIAGLGVGGIAVALAAQSILKDLFASLSIVLDKPFALGDYIVVGECQGTVEQIGVKTTRIRSLAGEQLIFANHDLLQSRIRNFRRMHQRRAEFTLQVDYQTPRAKLAAIPGMVREIVGCQSKTRFDRCHFKAYGESAILFEAVYYVLEPDYKLYLDVQQDINLAIHACFQQNEIEFAHPMRSLVIKREVNTEQPPVAGG